MATAGAGLLALLVFATAAPAASPNAAAGSASNPKHQAPFRTVVTADAHAFSTDDVASFYRLLMYSNDLGDGLKGLVYSSSFLRFTGNPPTRAWDTDLFQRIIRDQYSLVYENLRRHDARYPSPEHLLSLVKVGNISATAEMAQDSEGSLLIKDVLLADDDRPIHLQAWGGTNTIAAALRWIENTYSGTPGWDKLKAEISAKTTIYNIVDQDTVFKTYLRANWPELNHIMNRDQFFSVAYPGARNIRVPAELNAYFGPEFMSKIAQGPMLSNYPLATGAAAGQCFCEGDSPAFFNLIDTGLRNLESPTYGGWGGRFDQTGANEWSDVPSYMQAPTWLRPNPNQPPVDPNKTKDDSPFAENFDVWYPQTRWIPAIQNDFAARSAWQTASYEDANHAPKARVPRGKLDIEARPGQRVQLVGTAKDPDGDDLTSTWWQYREAGTYRGAVTVTKNGSKRSPTAQFVVPKDAQAGQTIHLILEVKDDGAPQLTRYQRVITTVK